MDKIEFCKKLNISEEEYDNIDKLCLPFIEFFNSNGLETFMSCEGHNDDNLHTFWICFSENVTDEHIHKFIERIPISLIPANGFYGKFIKYNAGYWNQKHHERWRYICMASGSFVENQKKAMNDLSILQKALGLKSN